MDKPENSAASSLKASTAFIDKAELLLPHSDYKEVLRLICILHYAYLSPDLFRAKIKYLFRNHQHLVAALNPLLPDEYQFSEEELPYNPGNYKDLEIYQKYINLLNDLEKKVPCPEALRSFCEWVKAHRQHEIDARELYGRTYDLLEGEFGLMKSLSKIFGNPATGGHPTTPSYIGVPEHMRMKIGASDREVLNNKLKLDNTPLRRNKPNDRSKYYLYRVDELIKTCLHPCPSKGASSSCHDRRYELHNLHHKLKISEKVVNKLFQKIKRRDINKESELREYWSSGEVRSKLTLVDRMFMNLQDLISNPHISFPVALKELRQRREKVSTAILQYDSKHNHKYSSSLA